MLYALFGLVLVAIGLWLERRKPTVLVEPSRL
jgi:hypothetical protein